MNFADKIGFASIIAGRLIGTERGIADEIADSAHPELATDGDFLRLLGDRAYLCPDCGAWNAPSTRADFEAGDACDMCAYFD